MHISEEFQKICHSLYFKKLRISMESYQYCLKNATSTLALNESNLRKRNPWSNKVMPRQGPPFTGYCLFICHSCSRILCYYAKEVQMLRLQFVKCFPWKSILKIQIFRFVALICKVEYYRFDFKVVTPSSQSQRDKAYQCRKKMDNLRNTELKRKL